MTQPRLSEAMAQTRRGELRRLLDHYVSPLHRKVRSALIDELVSEVTERDDHDDGSDQLLTLVLQVRQIAEHRLATLAAHDQRWDDFTRRYYRQTGDGGRRQAMRDFIAATVTDPATQRADLAALDRYLDYDALRERHVVGRNRILAVLELAITFIANGGVGALEVAAKRGRERMAREMFESSKLAPFLHRIAESDLRWQIRLAALEGLAAGARLARLRDPDGSWRAHLRANHLGMAVRLATDHEAHPWIQGRALALAFELADDLALDLASQRLLSPHSDRRDFLVRRMCVELLAASRSDSGRDVLRRLLVHGDPSEHVRQGLAEAFGVLGGFVELRVLAGLEQPIELSPRVRAMALQAACRSPHAATNTETALALVCDALEREVDPLPIRVACEDVVELVRHATANRCPLTRLMNSLLAVSANPDRPPGVHETAAAAAERTSHALISERRQWFDYLARLVETIKPGKSRTVALSSLHELPALPSEPMFVGRILAQLSREDFPLFATRRGDRLILWRGDRYRRRLWRILHELWSRRPNKRQAHLHTVGRRMKGALRAPPGGLDEVTATVVPGERVLVGEEGNWGRHLPTVDDLLDVPLWSGEPVHVFSSYGMTTVRPPSSWFARLRNRIALTLRYESVATVRIQSLAGNEPHVRRRFAEELRDRYGVELVFTRYDYPALFAAVPQPLGKLFVAPPLVPQPGQAAPRGAT